MKINEPASKRSGLLRIRLDIAYDGTNFSGFGTQPHHRTVQGELNKVLKKFLRVTSIKTIGAGRTDKGVHARGQVVHFDVSANIWNQIKDPMYKFRRLLPIDIQVRKVSIVPEDFDARYSALTRRYSYTVCDSKDGLDPLNSRFVLDYRKKLDDHSMNKASQMLIGLNDFCFGDFIEKAKKFTFNFSNLSDWTTLLIFQCFWESAPKVSLLKNSVVCEKLNQKSRGVLLRGGLLVILKV